MKAVILAGGQGTRISEETELRPKPMVQIGSRPILWHIMKYYSFFGVREFIICCGYKGHIIKEFFAHYFLAASDVTFDLENNRMQIHEKRAEPWKVTLVDTGENSMTGGRLKRIGKYLSPDPFYFAYGDCLSDVDLNNLLDHHRKQKALATLTAVQPPGRFGTFHLEEGDFCIRSFREKAEETTAWINGGFFVLEPEVLDYIEGDATSWEREPMEKLASEGKLTAFKHKGFWHPMDTLHDKLVLDGLWKSGKAPWRLWAPDDSGAA
jgi:glucose-1-phosphate cytidylyltransferase